MERESEMNQEDNKDDDDDSHHGDDRNTSKKVKRNHVPRHSIPSFNLESEEAKRSGFDKNVEKGNYVQNAPDTGLVPSDIQVVEDEIGNPPRKSLLDLWLDAEVSIESIKPANNFGINRAQSHPKLFNNNDTFGDEDTRLIQVSYIS